MAKLTRKQYMDINSKCKNGFSLDLHFFAIWGEKQLAKSIQITDTVYINVILFFKAKTENYKTVGYVAAVKFDKLKEINPDQKSEYKLYHSVDIKTEELTTELVKRRNMNILYELTSKYSNEDVLSEIADEIEKIKAAA